MIVKNDSNCVEFKLILDKGNVYGFCKIDKKNDVSFIENNVFLIIIEDEVRESGVIELFVIVLFVGLVMYVVIYY